jgi:hypothetical protein
MTGVNACARIALVGLMMAAFSVCALAQTEAPPADEAPAAQSVVQDLDFSMFGATRGQTVRLNAAFVVGPEFRGPLTAARIQVELVFLDGKGNLLKRSVETLQPRQGASLELDLDTLAGSASRFDLIPCLRVLVGSGIRVPLKVIGSVELIETATGRTGILIEPNERGVVKPPPAQGRWER